MRIPYRAIGAALTAAALTQPAAAPQATAARVHVHPLGDSITYGAKDGRAGYRLPLSTALTAAGVPHRFVGATTANSDALAHLGQQHHDGHPGYLIHEVAAGLDGRAGPGSDLGGHWLTGTATRAPIHPDVTIVHLGTNDVWRRHDPGTTYPGPGGTADLADPAQRATFVAHAAARLHALVDKLQALRPAVRVVLSTLVPMDTPPLDVTVEAYNARVAAVVAAEQARGERVVLADAWSAFTVDGLLWADDVHPMPAGYAVMAAVYRDAVVAALARP